MKAKKILVCISSMGHGGAENIIMRLCNGLENYFEIDLLLIQRCNEDLERIAKLNRSIKILSVFDASVPTISLRFKLRNLLAYLTSPFLAIFIFSKLDLRSYHIIHINLTQMALFSIFWKHLLNVVSWPGALVQTFHTNQHLLKFLSKIIFRASWKACDQLIIEIDKREVEKVKTFVDQKKITFIPFSVPELGIKNKKSHVGPIRWGSVARLRLFEKKYNQILEALAKLKNDQVDFIYHIAGDGPDRREIEKIVSVLGLQNNVVFHGFVANLDLFFAELDGLIVATVGEDSGIAGLQALAFGLPLIGLDTLGEGTLHAPDINFKVAANELELADLLVSFGDRGALGDYFNQLRLYKNQYIGDKVMIDRYASLFAEIACPKIDLVFMADYGRPVGKGLEVQSIHNSLIELGIAGVCTVRDLNGNVVNGVRSAHWTGSFLHKFLSMLQKFIWRDFHSRYYQEVLFDNVCANYYSKVRVPPGQVLYIVPRMPKTAKAAKAAGFRVVLHVAEMAPESNIKILNQIYGDSENWPTIWSKKGLLKSSEMIKHIDGAIAHTQSAKISYEKIGVRGEDIFVTPMGCNLINNLGKIHRSSNDGILRFLYVGNITKMKGSHLLLSAWRLVSDGYCELHICGDVYDDMAEDVSVAKHQFSNIYFHGHVNPYPLFKFCNVFVFPSLSESFGRAMLEACSSGMPIICNRNVALDDYYEEKFFGIYCDSNVESLVDAMNCMKEKSDQLAVMGQRAHDHFKDLTWFDFGLRTAAILKKISIKNYLQKD
jgi:glycosyltransferase involved in cell wall biosynthesis